MKYGSFGKAFGTFGFAKVHLRNEECLEIEEI
jgi:hypothetical protein